MAGLRGGAVTHSANEIEMLGARAARGAGAPPAQAALFGKALVHHLACKRDPRDVTGALEALPAGPILALALAQDDSTLARSYRDVAMAALPMRVEIAADLKAHLLHLASRTYVPASAASRATGAGAGVSDND